MGMLTVLVLLLAAIWSHSYSIFHRGTTRMSVTQRAREVVRRVTPMVMCALPPTEREEAVLTPALGESEDRLEFYTADNILQPMQNVNPRNPIHYRFRISLESDRTVRVRELSLHGGAPTGVERILAYNIEKIEFERLAVNLVKFTASTTDTIRNAANQEEEVEVERSAVISIPYYSSSR